MIVDMLLRLLGENVSQYQNNSDKWVAVSGILWMYSTSVLSYILAVLPWIWLLWQKKKKGRITKRNIIWVVVLSIFLFWLGYNLPWWFIEIMGGLAVRSMYGGQI